MFALNNCAAFARTPNERTQIEHNIICSGWAAQLPFCCGDDLVLICRQIRTNLIALCIPLFTVLHSLFYDCLLVCIIYQFRHKSSLVLDEWSLIAPQEPDANFNVTWSFLRSADNKLCNTDVSLRNILEADIRTNTLTLIQFFVPPGSINRVRERVRVSCCFTALQ